MWLAVPVTLGAILVLGLILVSLHHFFPMLALKDAAPFLAIAAATPAAVTGILNYVRDTKNKETEWLLGLFERFYESDSYKNVRRTLDNPKSADFARLMDEITNDADSSRYESFVDYLNFFEFICGLVAGGRMKRADANALFDYYLENLSLHDPVLTLCRRDGFEALSKELTKRRSRHA